MSPEEFEKARAAESEELLNHWVIFWDSNALDDTSTTQASLVHDCECTTDDQGNLWLMRGEKPLGVYSAGQWRKASRMVIRRYGGGDVIELPVDDTGDGEAQA